MGGAATVDVGVRAACAEVVDAGRVDVASELPLSHAVRNVSAARDTPR
jgi:hypothetical protein